MLHIKSTHFKEEKEQISQQNASTINSVQKNQKQFFNVNKFPCDSCDQTKHEINRQKMDKSVSKPSIKSVGLLKCPNCHQMILSERLLAKHLGNCKPKMDKNVSKPSINTDIVEMLANCPDENGYITMQ